MDAPFSLEQRVALQLWQDTPHVHPLTCGNCPNALPLIVETRGLVCGMCFHVQTQAPEECMTLPPDPATVLNFQRYDVSFFLERRLPSSQHTFTCTAAGPAQALVLLLADHPGALLPFTIGEATGQGEGHRELGATA